MISFLLCLALLIIGYFVYGKIVDNTFGPDDRETPAVRINDGVDYVVMPQWKLFLVQLLNIAGLGPIFGALQGALWGPVVFLWITFGTIFAGGVHDYFSGMMSERNDGGSIAEITGKYLGPVMQNVMRVFSVVLLIMVGTVFAVGPAGLIVTLCKNNGMSGVLTTTLFWLVIILVYYFIATFISIDAVIGKIYPIFGGILLFSAIGIFIGIFVTGMPLMNIWDSWAAPVLSLTGADGTVGTFTYADYFSTKHFLPIFFVTVACGILSGFHSTQTAIISRTMKSERQGRNTFYNMMVLEGFIAMVWAAGAMGVYNLALQEPNAGLATGTVGVVCKYLLGHVGGIIALLGVIVLPITSGDTALRALRLSLSETLHIDQSTNGKRIKLAVPIFALVIAILVFAKTNADGFNILWRYFAWANQTLSLFAFLCITAWMFENGKGKWAWIPMIPGCFYTFICVTYIANAHIGFNIPWTPAYIIGVVCAIAYVVGCCVYGKKRAARLLAK